MSDIERAVVEPDVSFDGDRTDRDGAVEGYVSPVVVVAVDQFGNDALG